MKKAVTGAVALFCIVFLLASCDIEGMGADLGVVAETENEGLEYLTVTFHSEGHTAGEVPAKITGFPVPMLTSGLLSNWLVEPAAFVLPGPGTLRKEGYIFERWEPRQVGFVICRSSNDYVLPLTVRVQRNIDLDAIWRWLRPHETLPSEDA